MAANMRSREQDIEVTEIDLEDGPKVQVRINHVRVAYERRYGLPNYSSVMVRGELGADVALADERHLDGSTGSPDDVEGGWIPLEQTEGVVKAVADQLFVSIKTSMAEQIQPVLRANGVGEVSVNQGQK